MKIKQKIIAGIAAVGLLLTPTIPSQLQKQQSLQKVSTIQSYNPYGYSQTLVVSGLYKLHEQGFRGQGIRVAYFGNGVEKSPFLSETEGRITRFSFVTNEDGYIGQKDYHENYVANLFLTYIPKIGTAPFLKEYRVMKIKNSGGGWSPDTFSQALDTLIALPADKRPHMIGFSFGVSSDSGIDTTEYSFDQVKVKLKKLQDMGVLVFGSAGNKNLIIADFPAREVNSVACKTFSGTKHINSNKGKWIFYGAGVDNFDKSGKPVKIDLTSYACPQLMGAIASYLSMKVAKGSDLQFVINNLESELTKDGYLIRSSDGISVKF